MNQHFPVVVESKGDRFVARCPKLDIAGEGESIEQARDNLRVALERFLARTPPEEVDRRLSGSAGRALGRWRIWLFSGAVLISIVEFIAYLASSPDSPPVNGQMEGSAFACAYIAILLAMLLFVMWASVTWQRKRTRFQFSLMAMLLVMASVSAACAAARVATLSDVPGTVRFFAALDAAAILGACVGTPIGHRYRNNRGQEMAPWGGLLGAIAAIVLLFLGYTGFFVANIIFVFIRDFWKGIGS